MRLPYSDAEFQIASTMGFKPMSGAEIVRKNPDINQRGIYTLLGRMEQRKLVSKTLRDGGAAKDFSLTDQGTIEWMAQGEAIRAYNATIKANT